MAQYGQPEIDPTLRPMSHEELGAAMIGMHDSNQKQVMIGAGALSLNNSNGILDLPQQTIKISGLYIFNAIS